MHYYQIFGWRVASELELKELFTSDFNSGADIFIKLTRVPDQLTGLVKVGVGFQVKPNHYLLVAEGVAKYYIIKGNEIRIELYQGASMKEVQRVLFSSVLGPLCYLRGALPLHAASIVHCNSSVLFAGGTGSGKSTIAAAFQKKGFQALTDDLSPVLFDGSIGSVSQGLSKINLWQDAFEKVGEQYSESDRIREGISKYGLKIKEKLPSNTYPVKEMFILEPTLTTDQVLIEPLKGEQKLTTILKYSYRFQLIEGLGLKTVHFNNCAMLAKQVKVYRVRQPRRVEKLEEQVNLVLKMIKE